MGWTIGVLGFDSQQGLGIFLFTTASRTVLPPPPPASHPVGTRGFFPGGKVARHETDHSSPSSAKVEECVELYLHFLNTPSWWSAQLKHRDNFTFTLFFFFFFFFFFFLGQ
jgi:hypothetical protein